MAQKQLDLAFVMDCTGSMGAYIKQAKKSIRKIVQEIVTSEACDTKLALVEYRDHPPQDKTFVTRVTKLTDVAGLQHALKNCSADGGGDRPEAMADGLHESAKLNWRENSVKIVVLIADAPPHGLLTSDDEIPGGCPAGHDPIKISQQMAEEGITLYCAGCEPDCDDFKEFLEMIAFNTGGRYVPLKAAKLLPKVITGAALEEIAMENWLKEVEAEVQKQEAQGVDTSAPEFYAGLATALESRGAVGYQTKSGASKLANVSSNAREWSKNQSCMASMKSVFKPAAPSGRSAGGSIDCIGMAYNVETEAFDEAQVERMVMKTKSRKNNLK